MTGTYTVVAVTGVGEVAPGADLAGLLLEHGDVADGDIVVVTSKVVSKSEGRVVASDRDQALAGETDRVVARRGPTAIVRTRHGLVMAAAGIDASNTAAGTVVLLPEDPDASARRLREQLRDRAGVNVGVVVSDTSGRAWRNGQTDIAVGAAGLVALDDHTGRTDAYGNPLLVTAPAVADELASAGDLAKGKLTGSPFAVVRGLPGLVLPAGDHGTGAAAVVRDEASDLFGYGTREAVSAALGLGGHDGRGFGAPAPHEEVAAVLREVVGPAGRVVHRGGALEVDVATPDLRTVGRLEAATEAVARAHGWRLEDADGGHPSVFRPAVP